MRAHWARAGRWLSQLAFQLLLGVIFLGGSLLALVFYADLPAGRRFLAAALGELLSDELEGTFLIGPIDRVSTGEILVSQASVRDPAGRIVLLVNGLSVRADLAALARAALSPGRALSLLVPYVRAERVDAYLFPDAQAQYPSLARAFRPRRSGSEPARAPGRAIEVWLPRVQVGHGYVRAVTQGGKALEGDFTALHAATLLTTHGVVLDVERVALVVRGLAGADTQGVASLHLRPSGALWTAFNGYLGDVELAAVLGLDGSQLQVTADIPRARAEQVRALWAPYPLLDDGQGHLEAKGPLDRLATRAVVEVGRAKLAAEGIVRLTDPATARLAVSAGHLDLRSLIAGAPETNLDVTGEVSLAGAASGIVAQIDAQSQPATSALGAIPAIDAHARYDGAGLHGHADLHEPSLPISADFKWAPDGSWDIDARSDSVNLGAPRLRSLFEARGSAALRLNAHIEHARVDARVSGTIRALEMGPVRVDSATLSGRVTGALAAIDRGQLELQGDARGLTLGPLLFAHAQAELRGPTLAPQLAADLESSSGPKLRLRAALAPRSERLDRLELEVYDRRALLRGKVARVELGKGRLRVVGFRLEGVGGTLEAGLDVGPQRVALDAHADALDLTRIARALALPRGSLAGKLDLDAAIQASGDEQRGHLALALQDGRIQGTDLQEVKADVQLDGPALEGSVAASLPGVGDFSCTLDTRLGGALIEPRAWQSAVGRLELGADHLPLDKLSVLLPSQNPIRGVRGEAAARLALDRTDPQAFPNATLSASTSGLEIDVAATSTEPPSTLGMDARLGGHLGGENGDIDATLALADAKGTLASLALNSRFDLPSLRRDPGAVLKQLGSQPIQAKLVIDERPIDELPPMLVPKGISGRIRSELTLRGTLRDPTLSAKLALGELRLGSDAALDVCGQLDYSQDTGRYGARAEVFLPVSSGTCSGRRVAQASAGGSADWRRLNAAELEAEPAWTGSAGLALEGLPLEELPGTSEARVRGRIFGAVMLDRQKTLPQLSARLELRDASIDRLPVGTARANVRSDGRALNASLELDERRGALRGELGAALDWQGLTPHIDDTRPIQATLNARDVDAVILTPLVRDVLSEVGGRLSAHLSTTFTPRLRADGDRPWTVATNGTLSLTDGTLKLARVGLRLEDVRFDAQAEGAGHDTLVTIGPLSARTASAEPNIAARANLRLDGLRVDRGNANVSLRNVPLQVEGVSLATLSGSNLRVDLERKPDEMFVSLNVPELTAELPRAATRDLIDLSPNANISVLQPLGETPEAADAEALPWRVEISLGDRVKVTRSDLFLPVTGKPVLSFGQELGLGGSVELMPGGRLDVPGLGRTFTIDRGTLYFDTGDPKNPRLNVTAFWRGPEVTVYVDVTGTFKKADLRLRSEPPQPGGEAAIQALLLGGSTPEGGAPASGIGTGANLLGQQLLAGTPLGRLEFKTSNEVSADQRAYATYTAAYPITDELWFEGSYKSLQNQEPTDQTSNAFTGTFDWRFRRNWSLRTELGTSSAGLDLFWQYRY